MAKCRHESLENVGEQKTDGGVNSYRRCTNCGMVLVMTPAGKLIGVPATGPGQSATDKGKGAS